MPEVSGIMPAALSLPKVIIYLAVPETLWIRDGNTSHSIQGG